jgi:hypothetical protein
MTFIVLHRSRGTRSYYLVESYRVKKGRSRKRTLCYLGREQDGTDTLEKAIRHWEKVRDEPQDRRRKTMAARRLEFLKLHLGRSARAAFERKRKQRWAEEAPHWQAIERLKRQPNEENAQAARRAFRFLALRYHPDHDGEHHAFIELRHKYERSMSGWQGR